MSKYIDKFKENYDFIFKCIEKSDAKLMGKMNGISVIRYETVKTFQEIEKGNSRIDDEWLINLIDNVGATDDKLFSIIAKNLYKHNKKELNDVFIDKVIKNNFVSIPEIIIPIMQNYQLSEKQAQRIMQNFDYFVCIPSELKVITNQENINLLAKYYPLEVYNPFVEMMSNVKDVEHFVYNERQDENVITAVLNNPHLSCEDKKQFCMYDYDINLLRCDIIKDTLPEEFVDSIYASINDTLFLKGDMSTSEAHQCYETLLDLFNIEQYKGKQFKKLVNNILHTIRNTNVNSIEFSYCTELLNKLSQKEKLPMSTSYSILLSLDYNITTHAITMNNLIDNFLKKDNDSIKRAIEYIGDNIKKYLASGYETNTLDKIVKKIFYHTNSQFKNQAVKAMIETERNELMFELFIKHPKLSSFELFSNSHILKRIYNSFVNNPHKNHDIKRCIALMNIAIDQAKQENLDAISIADTMYCMPYRNPKELLTEKYYEQYENFLKPYLNKTENYMNVIYPNINNFLSTYGKHLEEEKKMTPKPDIIRRKVVKQADGKTISYKIDYNRINENQEKNIQELSKINSDMYAVLQKGLIDDIKNFDEEELYRNFDNICDSFRAIKKAEELHLENVFNDVFEIMGVEEKFSMDEVEII